MTKDQFFQESQNTMDKIDVAINALNDLKSVLQDAHNHFDPNSIVYPAMTQEVADIACQNVQFLNNIATQKIAQIDVTMYQ